MQRTPLPKYVYHLEFWMVDPAFMNLIKMSHCAIPRTKKPVYYLVKRPYLHNQLHEQLATYEVSGADFFSGILVATRYIYTIVNR